MVKVKVDLNGIEQKFSEPNIRRGRIALASQILADSNKFVPKKQGTLRKSGRIAPDGKSVMWDTPYAKRQFYDESLRHKGITSARWDLRAEALHKKSWVKAFVEGANL